MARKGEKLSERIILTVSMVALTLSACGHEPDSEAWQAEVEAQLGHPVRDWDGYADLWSGICDSDDTQFETTVAVFLDQGTTADEFRTSIRHACPKRLADLEERLALHRNPCAGLDDEERADFEEAMGTGWTCP